MPETSTLTDSVFTATSAFSLAAFGAVAVIAFIAERLLLPKNGPWSKQDRFTFIWLVRTVYIYDFTNTPHRFFLLSNG
jgi:hypothetical protein